MRVVLQRVRRAEVRVGDEVVGRIGPGLLLLVGIGREDSPETLDFWTRKIPHLRVFPDEAGRMNRSALDVNAEILAVSQFTLYGDVRKGRRPGFDRAAPPEEAQALFELFTEKLAASGLRVATGRFGAHMEVELVNDGPVTLVLESS